VNELVIYFFSPYSLSTSSIARCLWLREGKEEGAAILDDWSWVKQHMSSTVFSSPSFWIYPTLLWRPSSSSQAGNALMLNLMWKYCISVRTIR